MKGEREEEEGWWVEHPFVLFRIFTKKKKRYGKDIVFEEALALFGSNAFGSERCRRTSEQSFTVWIWVWVWEWETSFLLRWVGKPNKRDGVNMEAFYGDLFGIVEIN